MTTLQPRVLLVEDNPAVRELNNMILSEGGYQVEELPPRTDPVAFAQNLVPDVIVVQIALRGPYTEDLLDRLEAEPSTRTIPIVVIATGEELAAAAKAGPNVRAAVVAPYDLDALESAVATALGQPPAAAILPQASTETPPHIAHAVTALSANARHLAIHALRRVLATEAYSMRFRSLTREVVDDLAAILGAIITGIGENLAPSDVFRSPEIRRAIDEHVRLREQQGLGASAAIREYQILLDEIEGFLRSLATNQHLISILDAFDLARQAVGFVDELTRVVIDGYQSGGE